MSDAIRNMSENIANGIRVAGVTYIKRRYAEIIYPPKEPTDTADEIIDRIKQKLKGYE